MALLAAFPVSLGYFRILRRLGCGGMAEIYLAYDEREQREVALKVVDMAQIDHVHRFRREVEVLRLLRHEHILPVFAVGEQDSRLYFAMPYLPYGSLRERLQGKPLTLQEAGSIFEQVADALQYAHECGVLHRDIKPSNILFRNEWDVCLADFGLARLLEQEGSITQTGCLIGTPHYLAPELANEDASQKSDQYGLGILLYKMLTGKVPFQGSNAVSICWKHIHEQPLPPSSHNPAIPPAIDQIILRALEKDPARRFGSVREMAEAYRQALYELKAAAETTGWTRYLTWKYSRIAKPLEEPSSAERKQKRPPLLHGFYRAGAATAMVVAFCVAPLYLGYSLYRGNMGPTQSPVALQAASAFLATQPFLQGNVRQPAGEVHSLPFTLSSGPTSLVSLSPSLSGKALIDAKEKKPSDSASKQVSAVTELKQNQETEASGRSLSTRENHASKAGGEEKEEGEHTLNQISARKNQSSDGSKQGKNDKRQLRAKGNGGHQRGKKGGKQSGHGSRKNK